MSQLLKILEVLNLFTRERITVSAEEVEALLGLSRPTAFRYLRQLCDAGFVARLSGRYALGPRIIELDYRSRELDPMLLAGAASLKALAATTGCSVMLSSIYGEQVINIYQEDGPDPTTVSFGRGRVMPLFAGAASKVILAHLDAARLKGIYRRHHAAEAALAIGGDWHTFSRYYRVIRAQGYYASRGEVDAGVTGVGAPVFNGDQTVVGALTIVFDSGRGHLLDVNLLGKLAIEFARQIGAGLAEPASIHRPAGS
ncbi:MAG: IclR family transcriptional regulator [Polaromonas sp.]|nr:IclR family transcriptional regulator [Polaromonas sp.]